MKVTVENLQERERVWGTMAQFDKPLNPLALQFLKQSGFGDAESRAVGCMGWIWCQWLAGTPKDEFVGRVTRFVDRGMEMKKFSDHTHWRSRHDLYLLHCAIFASSEAQLKKLAESVVDAAGHGGALPKDDGELYTSAWSGMLKYAILGDAERSDKQYEIFQKSSRPTYCHAATKQLVVPWLKRDWEQFRKNQKADFEKFWSRCRKNGVAKGTCDEGIVVNIDALSSIGQVGCWAHAGLAMLARRNGVSTESDQFWLPPHAFACLPM